MELKEFFSQNGRIALAFSGGVDSAYLLYAAVTAGADVKAYYVKSAFQPEFELRDAQRLAEELGAQMEVIPLDLLCDETIAANPADRCYHCKKRIFTAIANAAARDGYSVLMDGTNASDDAADRPGIRALQEMQVRSPLRECGITKVQVRQLSREAGLFTWDKPAYACLATRIPTGERITPDKLTRTEQAETLLEQMGFRDFRVRLMGEDAKLQLRQEQLPVLMERRCELLEQLKPLYRNILLDLEVRQ
ncbi:MAG: ATP-dependent sacrificial sulfur transferase LarE [Oscillospiraceae bacterium]|nr:ATP-dependent sacrificial sulfur transferase LarE [Oscillospiraceae bacterium]MBR2421327.1 ATP-dependent sacrificial sulfur transferase LarE [Oscillospiraceae bacterium]